MRHILQGFRMVINGQDYGIDLEEVTLPIPTPLTQEYRGGGMDAAVQIPMAAIEALEVSGKIAGYNKDILNLMGLGPGKTNRVTFRGGVLNEVDGNTSTHICVIEGALNAGSRDSWQRGEKGGIEFMINFIKYFRYEIDTEVVHEVQAYPPKRVVNGVDQLLDLNRALGF